MRVVNRIHTMEYQQNGFLTRLARMSTTFVLNISLVSLPTIIVGVPIRDLGVPNVIGARKKMRASADGKAATRIECVCTV